MRTFLKSTLLACFFTVFGLSGAAFAATDAEKACEKMSGAAKEKCLDDARKK